MLGEEHLGEPLPLRGLVFDGVLEHVRSCRPAWIIGTPAVRIVPFSVCLQPNRGGP